MADIFTSKMYVVRKDGFFVNAKGTLLKSIQSTGVLLNIIDANIIARKYKGEVYIICGKKVGKS